MDKYLISLSSSSKSHSPSPYHDRFIKSKQKSSKTNHKELNDDGDNDRINNKDNEDENELHTADTEVDTGKIVIEAEDEMKQPRKKQKLKQTYLDLEQRDFERKTCKICGMMYSPGVKSDEIDHNRFCSLFRKRGLEYKTKLKDEIQLPVPLLLPSTTTISISSSKTNSDESISIAKSSDERIVMVTADNYIGSLQKKVNAVLQVVDEELGSFRSDMDGDISKRDWKYFLFIKERMVVGFLSCHAIKYGFRVITNQSDKVDNNNDYTSRGSVVTDKSNLNDHETVTLTYSSNDPVSASLGVSKIWVHKDFRRNKIAHRMIEVARYYFEQDKVIPINQLAFSQPTPNGYMFAVKYFKNPNFIVYQ